MKYSLTLLILLLAVFGSSVNAQNWGGGVDQSKLNWGFMFQYVSTQNQIIKSANFHNLNYPGAGSIGSGSNAVSANGLKLSGVEPVSSPGFAIGGLLRYSLHKLVDLRFTPSLTLTQQHINYYWANPAAISSVPVLTKKETLANLIEMPIGLKLNSERVGNYKFYLTGGLKYASNITSPQKYDNSLYNDMEKYVTFKRNYLSYDAGAGVDFYMNYFKMSAEIKYARSINSILQQESHVFSQALDKVYLRHVSLSLIFETTL